MFEKAWYSSRETGLLFGYILDQQLLSNRPLTVGSAPEPGGGTAPPEPASSFLFMAPAMAAPPTIAVIAAAAGCRLAKPSANLAAAAPNLRAPFSKTADNLTANLPIPVPNNKNAAKSLGPWSAKNLTTESTFFAFFGSPNHPINLTRNLPTIILIKKSRILSRIPLTGCNDFFCCTC